MSVLAQVKPVLVLLLLACGQAVASPLAKSTLEASPVDDIIAQYPAMMSEGVRQGMEHSGQVDPMVVSTVAAVVGNAFRVADMEKRLVNDLSSSLTDEQLGNVRDWYQTPLAQKVSRAEIHASGPEAWKTMEEGAPELQAKYRGSERAKLFTRFDKAARATESAVDATLAVQMGLFTAMSAFQGDKGAGFQQIKQMLEGQRGQVEAVVSQQVYDTYLYTYQDLSVEELKEYISFLETDSGARFTRVVTASIQEAITAPIQAVGKQLARFLQGS